jgi:nucleoside-diphosphate-sugar epimerase
MPRENILITGASGEIGHGLIAQLAEEGGASVVALDLNPLDEALHPLCRKVVTGSILDGALLDSLSEEFDFQAIYHLAAILSTSAERQPAEAHRVNVEGTVNILQMALDQSRLQATVVKVLYPSSVAVYGLPDLDAKASAGAVQEGVWCQPTTMYGVNKLYCEHLGRYYTSHFRQLDDARPPGGVDFRALRYPGLISAVTVPSGGTSDYVPEMLHHAAQGEPYACFVREDTRIPFMAMPDAIKALRGLEAAPRGALTRTVYNVAAFNPSAGEFHERVKDAFPGAQVAFAPDLKRQAIVDSWPQDVDDAAARADWEWAPGYDLDRALEEYLIPTITERYRTTA